MEKSDVPAWAACIFLESKDKFIGRRRKEQYTFNRVLRKMKRNKIIAEEFFEMR